MSRARRSRTQRIPDEGVAGRARTEDEELAIVATAVAVIPGYVREAVNAARERAIREGNTPAAAESAIDALLTDLQAETRRRSQ